VEEKEEREDSMAFSPDIKAEPRNKDIEDIEDIEREHRQKVKRTDGLPTVDDLAKLMDKEVPEDEEAECEENKQADSLNKFIEIIVKVK
jgi:hypothetical protein